MPTITDFFGLHIYMNFIQHEHNPPHIHVEYGEFNCLIDFRTGTVIKGNLPGSSLKLALKWAERYKQELLTMWETQQIKKLPPL